MNSTEPENICEIKYFIFISRNKLDLKIKSKKLVYTKTVIFRFLSNSVFKRYIQNTHLVIFIRKMIHKNNLYIFKYIDNHDCSKI